MDAGVDAPLLPMDAGTDAFVPPDTFIPMCPDPVSVAGREASIPVDIIWVIDNSGSMIDDVERMRSNVNVFWDALLDANVDVRVIFVSQSGFAPGAPIEFARRYYEINDRVNSWDLLLKLLSNFRRYERYLRADAITHFVAVTDDDSRALPWEDFHAEMSEMLGKPYTFHSVASERVPPTIENPTGACSTPTSAASRPGHEYYALSDETGGIKLSICNEDWSELFALLSERIAVRIPIRCGYTLPQPPPSGIVYDERMFRISYTAGDDPTPIFLNRQSTEDACGDGWWYFEGSERIVLCPDTCAEIEAVEGRVDIDVGCAVGG
jgi:hypothetical protein